jgi:type IV secretory pathway VirB3-like protein
MTMPSPAPDGRHHVYKAMFRPLTLCGVERRAFFLALLLGAATFNLSYSLLAGLLVSALVYALARAGIAVDARMLPIALGSAVARPRYDAARRKAGRRG